MKPTVEIPDKPAEQLAQSTPDLERRALESVVLEAYRNEEITIPQLQEALGFTALNQVDGFLKSHGVFEPYSMADLEKERKTLSKLGL